MANFIFMLTHQDETVPDAVDVYESVADTALAYVGFKDIGLPVAEMARLVQAMRARGQKVMLEVVSTTREEELRSVQAGAELGVDYLLGGRHAEEAARIINGTGIRYFPFCGTTVGHPTRLVGTVEDIVMDAERLAGLPGVHGLDLLAYRFEGDVETLMQRVIAAVDVPVITAGSIDRPSRIAAVQRAGAWGFTIGSAVFEGCFATAEEGNPVRQQIAMLAALGSSVA